MTANIRLKRGQLSKYMAVAGMTATALARQSNLADSTVSRIVRGIQAPGEKFIAGLLAAFPDLQFDDLFEVVVMEGTRAS